MVYINISCNDIDIHHYIEDRMYMIYHIHIIYDHIPMLGRLVVQEAVRDHGRHREL